MRDIIFRGKTLDTGRWVYGSLIISVEGSAHIFSCYFDNNFLNTSEHLVDVNTVGQYTGFLDKYGNRVFEHDIVEVVSYREMFSVQGNPIEYLRRKMEVVFHDGAFCTKEEYADGSSPNYWSMNSDSYCRTLTGDLEILGNVFDNPDVVGSFVGTSVGG